MKISSAGVVSINEFTSAGIVHNDASGNLTSSLIVNNDIGSSAAIVDTKLATISTAGKVENSATTATNVNTANKIVARDASGNFSAGTITANLSGNATTAGTATNFSGSLIGDASGTQGATVVDSVGGESSVNVASATVAANAATNDNTAGTIVRRDGSGNFSASTITANLAGNVTGDLTGNADTATNATTAGTATNFSGLLVGNVSGTQGATVVDTVGGETAADVATATIVANAATSDNTQNTIVKRDASRKFITNQITISGAVTNPTDVATKDYVDSSASIGIVPKEPALVVGLTDILLSGTQTIDGVDLSVDDRVLLTGQADPIENGLWLSQITTWTRPDDFAEGDAAGRSYVLTMSGNTQAGTGWLCSTPTSVIDTDSITFVQFTAPGQTTGANVGTGDGQIYRDKTGLTLNFKTVAADTHMVITNNADDVTIGNDATSANTASTIVARDGSGTFAGSLTGAASQNVLKAGDTMTGNLNMATQSEIRYQDAAGGEYAGLRAPATVGTSYTIDLPENAPVAGQYLKAVSSSATTWTVVDAPPALTKTYYVTLIGDDSNDGSLSAPFRTVKYAVNQANAVATIANPVTINVGSGIFVEDNSGGAITITGEGISIVGSSMASTTIEPLSLSDDLFHIISGKIEIHGIAVQASFGSTASAFTITTTIPGPTRFDSVAVLAFQTGFNISSSAFPPVIFFENTQYIGNSTCIAVNNASVFVQNSIFRGPLFGAAANTGITATGADSSVSILNCSFDSFETAVSITGGARQRILSCDIASTINGIVCAGASTTRLIGLNFRLNDTTSINIAASEADTKVVVEGCLINGEDLTRTARGTGVTVTTEACLEINSGTIENVVTGIVCGTTGDTDTTVLSANGLSMVRTTTSIQQIGSTKIQFVGGSVNVNQLVIEDNTNIHLSTYSKGGHPHLTMGDTSDNSEIIYQILNGQASLPNLSYEPDFYGNKGTVYKNPNGDPTFNGTQTESNNACYYVVTGDRTKETSLNLISDAGNIGNSDYVRGWEISKLGTQADLAFAYSNNDTSGLAARGVNSVMQLNGFDNQVEFPTATNAPLPTNTVAKLVWADDTNLYRDSANTLKTDDDLIIDGLTTNRAVTTDANKKLVSSATTDTELGYLSGVTSSIQTQVDGKVSKTGDTMTGTLTLPAGTAANPSAQFTGSTDTGISAATPNTLSFDTNGNERMSISSDKITAIVKLIVSTLMCNQGVQTATASSGDTVVVLGTTSILLLKSGGNVSITVTFPPSPTNGQLFSILTGNSGNRRINLTNNGGTGGASIINEVDRLNAGAGPDSNSNGASVTYWYYSTDNAWYRYGRG